MRIECAGYLVSFRTKSVWKEATQTQFFVKHLLFLDLKTF